MNKELSDKAVEILSAIQTGVESGVGFAKEQLPDIAQQYVLYGRVDATASMAVALLILLPSVGVVIWMLLKGVTKGKEHIVIAMGFVALLSLEYALSHISSLLLVWFAPKIWLITQIKSIIS